MQKNSCMGTQANPGCIPAVSHPLVWLGLALGAVTLIAYGNSFSAGLTLDNRFVIGQDPRIRAWTGENLRLIFSENYWWPSFESDLFRPLTMLSYLLNYAVLGNGSNPAGYHGVNFALHWANACLVLVVLHRLTGRLAPRLLAGSHGGGGVRRCAHEGKRGDDRGVPAAI